jgi:Sec-independent protein translocase protein TatA
MGSDLGSAVKGFRKSMSDDGEGTPPTDGTESDKTADPAAKDK